MDDKYGELIELIREAQKRSAERPKGVASYTYDGMGTLTNLSVVRQHGITEHYEFDEAGNSSSVIEIPEQLFRQGKPKK